MQKPGTQPGTGAKFRVFVEGMFPVSPAKRGANGKGWRALSRAAMRFQAFGKASIPRHPAGTVRSRSGRPSRPRIPPALRSPASTQPIPHEASGAWAMPSTRPPFFRATMPFFQLPRPSAPAAPGSPDGAAVSLHPTAFRQVPAKLPNHDNRSALHVNRTAPAQRVK